jgi:asparagine synthase (glutamine-hydrolysing)
MDGIYGWLGRCEDHPQQLESMRRAMQARDAPTRLERSEASFGAAASSRFGKAALHEEDGLVALFHGRATFRDGALAAASKERSPAAAVAAGWVRFGSKLPALMSGTFAVAVLEPRRSRAFLAIDRMGVERLCFARKANQLVFGASAQSVAAHVAVGRDIDLQAVYDYLYFHAIPSPRTLYRGVEKLLPGQYLTWDPQRSEIDFYWRADYSVENNRSFDNYRSVFRPLLCDVTRGAANGGPVATFLSGGTDSSTVAGTLTETRGAPIDTFSVGFDAEGFDEMEYARCAVERFGSRAHEIYVKPQDIVDTIPIVASEYDEPFGNASAVPTYLCARAAREAGFETMLAGDGGDEIFGGNSRYAKQKLFEAYSTVPRWFRRGVVEPAAHLFGGSGILPFGKLKSYVDQANVPLPQRLETYNFLYRTPLTEIFEPGFLEAVDPASTDAALVAVYRRTSSEHFINRLMHIDLKFTLADNDLRKVGTMTEAAGVEVRFPLLDDRMVTFANHLPVDYKVRGSRLRWFFKEALRDLLPEKIINKEKHGFGLPFGVWSASHGPLTELCSATLSDLGRRRWIKPAYLEQILRRQREDHATYYGVMIWVTMMLETWLRAHDH